MQKNPDKKIMYKPAIIGFGLIIASILAAMSAALGSRIGWWDYNFAVIILQWAAYAGIFSSGLCLSGLVMAWPGGKRRGFIFSMLGLIIVAPMILFLQSWKEAKQTSPPISDITTNAEKPPSFWFAPNARTYGGFETETFQNEFYPEIKPLILDVSVKRAFDLCLTVIRKKGWKLWQADFDELHIEATATTFWFGFKDDVAIHITKLAENKSRVDIRSTSRSTGGDGGTNARRVLDLFAAIKKELNKK